MKIPADVFQKLSADFQSKLSECSKPRSKYGNQKISTSSGLRFDSKLEYERYQVLLDMELKGEVSNLELQVAYPLVVNSCHVCTYIADFVYQKDGEVIVEDAKGLKTSVYRIKKMLMLAVYGIKIQEVSRSLPRRKTSRRKR